jgi:hypothetical protein
MSEKMAEIHQPRRVSAWKIAAVFAAAFVALVITFFFWIGAVAERRWAEMERKVRELMAETRSREMARPPLRGTAVAGNAWDEYQIAFNELSVLKGQDSILGDFVSRTSKADRSKAEPLVSAHLTALDALRRGASRSTAQFATKWEKGFAADIPGLLLSQRLGNVAACRSRFLIEEGKPREAAELLLDTCQFARDVGYNSMLISEMIAIAIYSIAFEELRDLILSGKLSRDDLLEVERELEQIDRSFVRNGHSMMNEALCAGAGFLMMGGSGVEQMGLDGPAFLMTWRYGFSSRLMLVDAFDYQLERMKRYADGDDKPWAEMVKVAKELDAEGQQAKNSISRMLVQGLTASNRVGRERRAQLRLLRVAAHYRATGEVLDLGDPLGTKLRTSKSGDTLKIWSLGKNGVDDGGVGDWNPGKGLDIVLDVPR